MELFKSTISKALGSGGPQLEFKIGNKRSLQLPNSIWEIYDGIGKDKQKVTVFIFDIKKQHNMLSIARNYYKRVRTIRYPGCLKFIDGAETETQIIIGTEEVETLENHLNGINEGLLRLGIYRLASTMKFLTQDCRLIHGNLTISSIFVTISGEWKVGGFEFLAGPEEIQLQKYNSMFQNREIPPEFSRNLSTELFMQYPIHVFDAWCFSSIINQVFGNKSRETKLNMPNDLLKNLRNLSISNPNSRMDFEKFIARCKVSGGYFDDKLIETSNFLENFALQEKEAKENFLTTIESLVDKFPLEFCQYKLLPELLQSLQFAGAGSKALKPALIIGSRLSKEDFNTMVIPAIINLFQSSDRQIRLALCEKMPLYIENISNKIANDTIYPNLSTGFLDTTPIIREQTLKAVAILCPKLDSKTVNDSLLRNLAKLQSDPQPGIRTVIEIKSEHSKLSPYLKQPLKSKVLIQSFVKSLKDPFPPARKAALMGISASVSDFGNEDIVSKLIPGISSILVDKERANRDLAFEILEIILKNLKIWSNNHVDEKPAPIGESKEAKSETSGWSDWAMNRVSALSNESEKAVDEGTKMTSKIGTIQYKQSNLSQPRTSLKSVTKNSPGSGITTQSTNSKIAGTSLKLKKESDNRVQTLASQLVQESNNDWQNDWSDNFDETNEKDIIDESAKSKSVNSGWDDNWGNSFADGDNKWEDWD